MPDPPDLDAFLGIHRVFEQNAEYAQRAALYRLAQTWRVVGTSIAAATRRRAQLHRERTRVRHRPTAALPLQSGTQPSPEQLDAQDKPSSVPQNPAVRAILVALDKTGQNHPTAQDPTAIVESSSNLTTPLARPTTTTTAAAAAAAATTLTAGATTASILGATQKTNLLDLDHEEITQLPPAARPPHANPPDAPREQQPLTASQSLSHEAQLYQSADRLEERRAIAGGWRTSPRVPVSFKAGHAESSNVPVPPPPGRHYSGDSFTMFSTSTDSRHMNSVTSSFASSQSQPRSVESENWSMSPVKSSFGNARTTSSRDQQPELSNSSLRLNTGNPVGINRVGPNVPPDESLVEFSSGERALREMEHLRRNNQLMRHDSSESDAYSSSRDSLFSPSFDHNIDMEASGTIVPDFADEVTSQQGNILPSSLTHATESAAPVLDAAAAENALLLSDFQALHVDAAEGLPFSVIGLLDNLLTYHTSASDAQFSSLLLLLLAPLLPQTQIPSATAALDVNEVLIAFADTFISLGLTPTQAKAILSTQLSQLIAAGINPYQAEAILHTYHAQLHSLALFNSAASLRRLAYPAYPAVYEQALKDTQLGLLCLSCKSPINNPKDKMRCESCRRAQAPCSICWGKYPAFEPITAKKKAKAKLRSSFKDLGNKQERSSLTASQALDSEPVQDSASPSVPTGWSPPTATLWTWCPLCGHGGHTNCLSSWFADPELSDGACATEGCLCDCVHGRHRDEKMQEVLRRKAEKQKSKVVRKGDDWKAHESKAVSAVRKTALDVLPDQQAGRKEDSKRVRKMPPEQSP